MLSKFRLPFVILICLSVIFSSVGSISANTDGAPTAGLETELKISGFEITPMMLYINRESTRIIIDTYGQTTAIGSLTGYPGITDEVWIYLYLERYINGSWQTFNSWFGTYYSYYGYLEEYDVVPHGYYYRVRGSYYAWSGNSYEHDTGYSSTIYY